jgi:hypothetical protein
MLVDIADDWLPTPESINALPLALRTFIENLETRSDPAGTVRENILLKDENRQLRVALAEARDPFVAGEKGENGGVS